MELELLSLAIHTLQHSSSCMSQDPPEMLTSLFLEPINRLHGKGDRAKVIKIMDLEDVTMEETQKDDITRRIWYLVAGSEM